MFYFGALFLENLWLSPRGSIMKIFSKESILSVIVLLLIILLSKIKIYSTKNTGNKLKIS